MDSTGILQVVGNKLTTLKQAINASQFILDKEVKELISAAGRADLTLCHVRAATTGNIDDASAHPFTAFKDNGSKIVGVHNGTLRNWSRDKNAKGVTIDSEWAIEMIAIHGEDAFQYFDGAFAFVWYDEDSPDTVFMARNEERPLHFMVADKDKTLLFASEPGMLAWLAERRKFSMSNTPDMDKLYSLTPGFIYEFSLINVGRYQRFAFPKLDKRLLTPDPLPKTNDNWDYDGGSYPSQYPYSGSHSNYHGGYNRTHYRSAPYGQDNVLKHIKDALRSVRNKMTGKDSVVVEEESPVVTADELTTGVEDAIRKEIEEFAAKKEKAAQPPLMQGQFLHSPNAEHASPDEVAASKQREMFGQVVSFNPIFHDEDTLRAFGWIEVTKHGKKQTYDAEVRYVLSDEYVKKYEHATTPPLMSCIGINSKGLVVAGGKSETILLAPLSAQDSALMARLASKHAAVN